VLLKIQCDDEVIFDSYTGADPLNPGGATVLDMEAYHIPAVLRRVLKISKIGEVI